MVKEFADAAFSMKVGEVTAEPVKTQFGLHFIKLAERKEASVRPLDEVRAHLTETLLNEKKAEIYNNKLKELREKYKVAVKEDEKKENEKKEEKTEEEK